VNDDALARFSEIIATHDHDWRVRPSEQHPGMFLLIDWTTGVVAEDNLTADGAALSKRIRSNPLGPYGLGAG
jgi:hypothetical protein